jgi:hypothetical protein
VVVRRGGALRPSGNMRRNHLQSIGAGDMGVYEACNPSGLSRPNKLSVTRPGSKWRHLSGYLTLHQFPQQ